MAVDYTSAANIESIKRRASLPSSQDLYPDRDLAKILSEELLADILPLMMNVREEYFLHNHDEAIDTEESAYEIPERATGNKVADVVLLNSDGLEEPLSRVDFTYLKRFGNSPDRPGFLFRDDKVILYPDATSLGSFQLRQKYYRRPNNIVITTDAGQITAIDTAAKQVTLGNLPSAWTVSTVFDFIKGRPSFRSLGDDQAITTIDINGKILTFSAALPDDLAVGDWVSVAGTSPIAQIPYEVHNLLNQRAVIKVLEGLGDKAGLSSAADVYKDMADKFKTLITPRADGSPKKIVRGNALFGGNGMRRSGWWQP